ncbi:SDR family NAD(P)-dependent oxidoreductase [Limosilactobacillus sp.]|uniref:SDR family NAD(P)-dependent oxidoreductase n=1 Tax=Limosilactobacillus sp. TaxID=2773925 RepID=UPI00345E818D
MGLKHAIKETIRLTNEKKILPIEVPLSEDKVLKGRTALIAGGNGGIGLAIAKTLLQSGSNVILGGTNKNKLISAKRELKEWDNKVKVLTLDLLDYKSIDRSIKDAVSMFGQIDIFINAAGVHIENVDFWKVTPGQYDRVMNINLKGVYFYCIQMAKYWKANNMKGNILLISSSRGSEPAWSPYGISKWGLNGMVQGLAQMLTKYNIIVNAIAPGSTATPLLGIHKGSSIYTDDNVFQRMVMPSEVGNIARLLVSDAGDMLSGEIIHLSAGRGVWDIR